MDRLAGAVDAAYRERFGVVPVGEAAEAVVLFADAADYERFKRSEQEISHLPAAGHTSLGLVAIGVGERHSESAGAVLVHEIVHLLNRRALGPALPPWLDEGIADALAISRLGPDGALDPRRVGGTARSTRGEGGRTLHVEGGWASVAQLRRSLAGAPLDRLPRLLAADWRAFVAVPERETRYAESALFVRFLLDAGDPRLEEGFRAYLQGVAAGGDAGAEALRSALGIEWPELAVRFRVWLEALAATVEEEVRTAAPA
jgi:hypothetical protein